MPPADDKGVFREIATPLATEVSIDTGSLSEVALAANPERVYALFINDSDAVMYLRLGETAVAHEGILLAITGGSYEITLDNLYRGVVNVICASSGKVLMITEGV